MSSNLRHGVSEGKRSERQIAHAIQMDTIARLSSSIAHEFASYLSVVVGHAEQALTTGSASECDQHISEIINATARASRVSDKLLALSRPLPANPTCFDASIAITQLIAQIEPIFDKAVTIDLDLPTDPAWIRMDRNEFNQVLLNAARNSSHAISPPGTFRILLSASDGEVTIRIVDSGHGIPGSVIGHVFEPFFTTRDSGEGIGLGLSTAYWSIIDAGGELAMESSPGNGACLTVRLPRVDMRRLDRPSPGPA